MARAQAGHFLTSLTMYQHVKIGPCIWAAASFGLPFHLLGSAPTVNRAQVVQERLLDLLTFDNIDERPADEPRSLLRSRHIAECC